MKKVLTRNTHIVDNGLRYLHNEKVKEWYTSHPIAQVQRWDGLTEGWADVGNPSWFGNSTYRIHPRCPTVCSLSGENEVIGYINIYFQNNTSTKIYETKELAKAAQSYPSPIGKVVLCEE